MKKYTLGNRDEAIGLYRIVAAKNIKAIGVKKGDIGGYIESENNLSHENNAWVSDDAQVSGNALVSGDARVSGNAQVSGNARVFDDAWIFGNAQVSGNAWVSDDARVSGNAWVSDDAQVSGDAQISGDAWVSGNALVSGDARVFGDAWVSGNAQVFGDAWNKSPLYIQGSRYALTNCKYGHVQISCMCKTFKEWQAEGEKIGKEQHFTDSEIAEYMEYIMLMSKLGK